MRDEGLLDSALARPGNQFEPIDEIQTMLSLASGEITDQEFADWVRTNCKKYIPQT